MAVVEAGGGGAGGAGGVPGGLGHEHQVDAFAEGEGNCEVAQVVGAATAWRRGSESGRERTRGGHGKLVVADGGERPTDVEDVAVEVDVVAVQGEGFSFA